MSFNKKLKYAAGGDLGQVRIMLSEDPSLLNAKSGGHNRTFLWEAVNKNHFELAQFLLSQGADTNIPGRYRAQTHLLLKPYCIASAKRRSNLVELLASNGHEMDIFSASFLDRREFVSQQLTADPTLINTEQIEDKHWKVTPLHFALGGGNLTLAKWMIDQGSDVRSHSNLLYEMACRMRRLDFIELITNSGGLPAEARVSSVFHHNDQAIIGHFRQAGLDPNSPGHAGWPAIVYLSRGDKGEQPKRIQSLMIEGADPNQTNPHGSSALHAAAKAGFTSVLKVLIDGGAKINLKDNAGNTPLMIALKFKRASAAQILVSNGGV